MIELKKINIDLYSDIYRQISFKLGMMIENTKRYIYYISLDDLDLHLRSQLYEKLNTSGSIFSQI